MEWTHLVATKLNKLMIIFDMDVIFFSITLFPNKNNFVTNNSKKIHVHIMLKTFRSTLRQDYEFHEWLKAKCQCSHLTSWDSTLWIWNKEKGQINETSHYHTSFINTFQIYIHHKKN
jgi:hypothetical protein